MTSPTNWIIASGELAHRHSRVRLDDGREGVIVRVADNGYGWPVVQVTSGESVAVRPSRIAAIVR